MKKIVLALSTFFAVYAVLLSMLYFKQRDMIYFPNQEQPKLEEHGMPMAEQVEIETEDGYKLFSWWVPPKEGMKTIIYFHGNAGHLGPRSVKARNYVDAGYGALLISYRYNAGSGGEPSEAGLHKDADAAYKFVRDKSIAASDIIAYGESLGSGVASHLAHREEVAGLALEAPYTSIYEMATHRYPFIFFAKEVVKDHFDTEAIIKDIKVPIIIFHGTEDRVIPVDHSDKLAQINTDVKYVRVKGANHINLYDFGIARNMIEFMQAL